MVSLAKDRAFTKHFYEGELFPYSSHEFIANLRASNSLNSRFVEYDALQVQLRHLLIISFV